MGDESIPAVEDALDRAEDLPADEAESLLRSAAADLEALRERNAVDDETADALENRLSQRMRAIEERDAYGGELGSALNPDEEDAA